MDCKAPPEVPQLVVLGVVRRNLPHQPELWPWLMTTGLPAAPVPVPCAIVCRTQLDRLQQPANPVRGELHSVQAGAHGAQVATGIQNIHPEATYYCPGRCYRIHSANSLCARGRHGSFCWPT